ncbi:MAG: type I-B CRISPR-associated protein Cas8b1/Cst1 [Bacteroidota bacterium]|nr:type I-B CRISPR-associated protein Cas8b1/Cst1 [Bacteroidota bacterium]
MNNFVIEEGHIFQREDFESYAKWKINDLLKSGMSSEEIINFYDEDEWRSYVKSYIMSNSISTINLKWLTNPTGDPFADAGGFVIKYLLEKFPEKSILELIDYITKIYVEKWEGKLNAFFLNSKITQPAFQGPKKIEETHNYFESLINETEPYEIGYCRITGQETKLFFAGRDNSIMTGSGTLINFHHFFQKGISLSKEAIIRMHFIPFACQQLQGKIGLMQSSSEKISRLFVKQIVERNLHDLGLGVSEGVLKAGMSKPANAIFDFVDYALTQLIEFREENNLPSLTLYHFTNFGASPDIQVYQLPANVFLFYRTCLQPKFKKDWLKFIRSYYSDSHYKGAKFNAQTDNFEIIKSKETESVHEEEYRQWYNRIYNKLLTGDSIRPEILQWSRLHPFNFEIVSIYQKNIIGMKKETIDKIKELAVFLVREEDADKIKKRIKALDGAKNASSLRRFILKDIVAANYAAGNENPIITVEDYINYLFPDGSYWNEIRDLLLIAIYQELHERNLISEELKMELKDENENESNNN